MNFKNFILVLFSFIFLSAPCSQEKYQKESFDLGEIKTTITAPTYIQPGSNILVELETKIKKENLKVQFNGQEIPIFSRPNKLFCLIGIDVSKPQGTYDLLIYQDFLVYQREQHRDFHEVFKKSFTVKKSSAPKVDFGKEPKHSKQFLDKYFEERKIYAQIMEKTEPNILFNDLFGMPLGEVKITGTFGDQRTYSDTKNARIHRGIDLKAPMKTEICAINDGKILMARNFTFEGNFIAIDHGGGIISFYMHLSEFKVKEGNPVKRGQLIGLSGSTGNSNSPHLHFSIKINKETTNPLEFIEIINKFLQ